MSTGWNPWYVEYARYHGRDPEEQYAHDLEAARGYPMMPYSRWIERKWEKYREARGTTAKPDKAMQEDFTAWLYGE